MAIVASPWLEEQSANRTFGNSCSAQEDNRTDLGSRFDFAIVHHCAPILRPTVDVISLHLDLAMFMESRGRKIAKDLVEKLLLVHSTKISRAKFSLITRLR